MGEAHVSEAKRFYSAFDEDRKLAALAQLSHVTKLRCVALKAAVEDCKTPLPVTYSTDFCAFSEPIRARLRPPFAYGSLRPLGF